MAGLGSIYETKDLPQVILSREDVVPYLLERVVSRVHSPP